MKKIITNTPDTGVCTIDVNRTVQKWNSLFWISQWKSEYRLIKYKQKNSPVTTIKVTISEIQARELIKKLNLIRTPDPVFRSAASWRTANCA
jgi:hypothetical protein